MAKMYYEKDCDINYLNGKKIAIIGYGSQGHAHALNLKDSGCDVCVGLRAGSKNWKNAEDAGLKVMTVADAAKWGDIVMMLINDEVQADVQSRIFFQHLDGFRIPGCYGHHFHAAGNTRAVGLDAGFVDGMQGTEIVNADDKCRGAGLSPYRQCSCCEQASGNHVFQS